MKPANRIRTLWALVALAALYGLGAVIIYYTAGFGALAFMVSLIVYSVILVVALLVAASDLTGDPNHSAPSPRHAGKAGPNEGRMRVVHEDGSRRILRADSENIEREADFLVVDGNTVRPLSEIEEELDRESAPAEKAKPAVEAFA